MRNKYILGVRGQPGVRVCSYREDVHWKSLCGVSHTYGGREWTTMLNIRVMYFDAAVQFLRARGSFGTEVWIVESQSCDMNDTGLSYDVACELDLVSAVSRRSHQPPDKFRESVGGRAVFSPCRCPLPGCQVSEKAQLVAVTGAVNSAVSLRGAYGSLLPHTQRSRHHRFMQRSIRTACLALTLGMVGLLARGQDLAPR